MQTTITYPSSQRILLTALVGAGSLFTCGIGQILDMAWHSGQFAHSVTTADDRGSGRVTSQQAEFVPNLTKLLGLRGSGRLDSDTPETKFRPSFSPAHAYRGSGRLEKQHTDFAYS